MKKISIATLLIFLTFHVSAQWNTSNPPHIYYSTGNVGIGVTNPGNSRLSVRHEASQAYHNAFTLSSINANDHWPFVLTSNNLPNHSGFVSQADGDIYFLLRDKDGNADVQLHSEGNSFVMGKLGLGLTSPEGKLHVAGVAYIGNENGYSWHRVAIGGSGGNYGSIGYGYKYTTEDSKHTYAVADNASQLEFRQGGFVFRTAAVGTAGAQVNFTDVMKILQSGKVGIGTNDPSYNLQVNSSTAGNLRLVSSGSTPSAPSIDIFDSTHGTEFTLSPSAGKVDLFTYSNHALAFGTANNEKMRINPNGNVGIGTTSTDAKLTVAGDIHSREVKVTVGAGSGPDYVFEPTYNLPTLTETEAYIKANKHLPEVPSAKEMEANGINLSEMNMLLLKKVEELTLHLIS